MRFYLLLGLILVLFNSASIAGEPIVVLEYSHRNGDEQSEIDARNHPFRLDTNFQQSHKVMADETLGHIMQAYYGGSGLNMSFVELAIVQFNKHAFVRGNPNFLYADKTLHLPSVNQIQSLALGKKEKSQKRNNYIGNQDEIFFFGG